MIAFKPQQGQQWFVADVHENQFGCEPSEGQVFFWLTLLQQCGSAEAFINEVAAFDLADVPELDEFDAACLSNPDAVANKLLAQRRAADLLGNLVGSLQADHTAFIEAAYLTCLRRPVDHDGRVAYLRHLEAGLPRASVLVALLQSPESLALAQLQAEKEDRYTLQQLEQALSARGGVAVHGLFSLFLDRAPEPKELQTWAPQCDSEQGTQSLLSVLGTSLEFGLRKVALGKQADRFEALKNIALGKVTRQWRRWWTDLVGRRSGAALSRAAGQRPKVLMLCTFPIDEPRHGGQHRALNIKLAYESAGYEVVYGGVLGSENYAPAAHFLPYPGFEALAPYIENPFLMDDWALGQLFANDDKHFARLAALFDFVPDVVHVELPWLFQFARRFVESHKGKKIPLVYGAENIEYQLKRGILKTYMGDAWADTCSEWVRTTETEAVLGADGVCCVSEHDVAWTAAFAKCPVVLAPNGVSARLTTHEGIQEALALTQHRKFALYCASGHPPNVVGFYDMLGGGVGCMPPDSRLVVAGSAGQAIVNDPRFRSTAGLARCLVTANEVSESCLQALLLMAHVIVLPITHGGGTNLKTAEAIWACRRVVATRVAMRGFEAFEAHRGVHVADNAVHFKALLRQEMLAPPLRVAAGDKLARQAVLWTKTLEPLVNLVGSLVVPGTAGKGV